MLEPHRPAAPPGPTVAARGLDPRADSVSGRARGPRAYVLALGLVAACTGLAFVMERHFAPANLTMIYLLGVVISATAFGRRPAIVAAIASVAVFDFLFVPPRFTFEVDDTQYLVTFGVMLVVAVVIGTLTAWLREQRELAARREKRTAVLYQLSRDLGACSTVREVATAAAERITAVQGAPVAVLLASATGELRPEAGAVEVLTPELLAMAQNAWHQPARLSPPDQPGTASMLPIEAGVSVAGVLVLFPAGGTAPGPEDMHLMRALAHQTGLALERCRLTAEAERARLEAETERMRSALLSSVSHDLRTPLAAITGAASQLRAEQPALPEAAREALAESIVEEATRLDRLIGNLLDMTRLESGMPRLQKEWQPLEDLLGAVLGHLDDALAGRPVRVVLPEDLPLVSLDSLLFGQVVTNLVGNAARYSPAGTEIELRAAVEGDQLRFEVADRGPGFAPGELDRVFEKFFRGREAARAPGTGLGLAISRAAVEAHGGTLVAENRSAGGARLVLKLPLGTAPPPMAPEPREHDSPAPTS